MDEVTGIRDQQRWDATLTHLDGRLRRLEHQVRASAGDQALELDAVGPELVVLAASAERAETVDRMLLGPRLRAACEQTVEAWRTWQRRYEHARARAVAASRTIATTSSDHDGHRNAVGVFQAARTELAALRQRRQRGRNAADNARRQLEHDRCLRQRHAEELAAGQRACATLAALLRSRIDAALESGRLLPLWFVDAMGPAPPPDDARWPDTAIQLLAYRITYSITDRSRPLGTRPGPEASARRREWFRELACRLDAYRNPLRSQAREPTASDPPPRRPSPRPR